MWIYTSNVITNAEDSRSLFALSVDFMDVCCACFLYGADSIYSLTTPGFWLDIRFTIFAYSQLIFQDSYNPYYDITLALSTFSDSLTLLYSTYLSEYVGICTKLLPTVNANHPLFQMYTWKPGVVLTNATFFYALANSIPYDVEANSYIDFAVEFCMFNETFHTVCLTVVQIYAFIYFVFILIMLYANPFESSKNKFKSLDQEFLSIQANALTEEELGAFEDKFFYYLFFSFIVGWLALNSFYALFTSTPIMSVLLWVAPTLAYFLVYIPYNFLRNFGISFTCYLRGAGVSSSILNELLFDLIVGAAMFLRFFIQGVRLMLILFVYVSLHDLWVLNEWSHHAIYSHESLLSDLAAIELNAGSITFFLFFKVPFWIWYLIFETGHVFFVITAQYFAFFAMIFWLFFFLYTCFTFETLEDFFGDAREVYKNTNLEAENEDSWN